VLHRFAASTDHNVLGAVTDRLGTLDLILRDSQNAEARKALHRLVADLFSGPLAELGYEVRPGEAQNEIQRRALYISAVAALARDPDAIARAEALAEVERHDPRAVDANLAGAFVHVAAKFGDGARYDSFVKTYQKRRAAGATPQESLRYLYALPAFRPAELVQRTLHLLDDGTVPQEAVGAVLSQLLQARHGQGAAWAYLKDHWGTLCERVGDMGLSRLVEAVGALAGEHRPDIVGFFEQNPPIGAERALSRALESLDQREELSQRITPGLLDYFLRPRPAK
jgi:hypothetical protein